MQVIRDAGYNERRCISRDILGLYGSIVTVGTYNHISSSEETGIPEGAIIKALKYCATQHSVLCTVIQRSETEQPQLARLSELDLTKHMVVLDNENAEEETSHNLRNLLERIQNEPLFDYEDRPQWRVYVAPSPSYHTSESSSFGFQVAFASSHALADGMSGLLFHRTFLQALQMVETLQLDVDPIWTVSVGGVLPPALDQVAKFPISWSFLLQPLLAEYLPASLARLLGFAEAASNDTWRGAEARPERRASDRMIPTAVRITLIKKEVLAAALEACRRRQVRLTGLLNHLVARALAQSLSARRRSCSHFAVATVIDLRRCLPGDRTECMANYVSAVSETISTSANMESSQLSLTEEDWQAMQQSTQKLSEASKSLSDQPIALLKYLSNYRQWTLKNAALPAKQAFGMSNLGLFEAQSGNGWSVDQMIFSQSANGTGDALNVNVASAKGGPLAIVMTWWPGMLGLERGTDDEGTFVEEILGRLASVLEELS